MGKKALSSLFSRLAVAADSSQPSPSPPWQWPSCANPPQTASFRGGYEEPCTTAAAASGGRSVTGRLPRKGGEMYKTVNSVYFDDSAEDVDGCGFFGEEEEEAVVEEDDSFSTMTAAEEEWSEAVIRSLGRRTSTDRFFFDTGPAQPATNSILATARAVAPPPPPSEEKEDKAAALADSDDDGLPLPAASHLPDKSQLVEESVAVAVDSEDPYRDFRASMEEMVAAHGLRDWEQLEELLSWYLRVNGKHNHPLIVGAFVDLLLGLAPAA
ncbi:hypothetical protein E2562_024499 [Oryza meyeriana var. granulata]|uniref:Transcription repressor n=1 Tax=Oryza meyeriana var. granulata TaxID=110450 RepID=A0A6G1BNT5_9ORYZ|nr:hypothetical protein E2562_024499 [Oryza meyeriana var. granulata]